MSHETFFIETLITILGIAILLVLGMIGLAVFAIADKLGAQIPFFGEEPGNEH